MGLFKGLFIYKSVKLVADKVDKHLERREARKNVKNASNEIKIIVEHDYNDGSGRYREANEKTETQKEQDK